MRYTVKEIVLIIWKKMVLCGDTKLKLYIYKTKLYKSPPILSDKTKFSHQKSDIYYEISYTNLVI